MDESETSIENKRINFNWGDKTLFRNISFAVVVVGIGFVFFAYSLFNVPSTNATNTSANIFVIGSYSWTLLGLLLLAPFIFGVATNGKTTKSSFLHSLFEFLTTNGGLLITCLMIIYAMILRIAFMNQFTIGKVAEGFYGLEGIFNWIFLITIYFLYKKFQEMSEPSPDKKNIAINRLILILFGYIGFIILAIMNVMLAFFSTDG